MRAFDTNVVVRLVVEDDEAQGRLAVAALRAALSTGGVYLSKIVLVETVWVLKTAYGFSRLAIASALRSLLAVENVVVESLGEVEGALLRFEQGAADFSDYLILERAHDVSALPVATFDRRFAREEGVELLGQ